MRGVVTIILTLAIALGVIAAPEAGAGLFGKDKARRTEMPESMRKARRIEKMPRMSFYAGELQQDGVTGWTVGDTPLQLAKDCLITTAGQEGGTLSAGRQVVVMGPKIGNTILAWTVEIAALEFGAGPTPRHVGDRQPSAVDPNCGELVNAPN